MVSQNYCGEGIYPRLSAQHSQNPGAATQPIGDKSPHHRSSPSHEIQRSTAGQKHIGQQLIARQSGQVQTLGKRIDAGSRAAD